MVDIDGRVLRANGKPIGRSMRPSIDHEAALGMKQSRHDAADVKRAGERSQPKSRRPNASGCAPRAALL